MSVTGIDDQGQTSLDDIELSTVFPLTKMKAQILQDEGVGRISSKAIQLVGSCSAIFLRRLAGFAEGPSSVTLRDESSRSSAITSDDVKSCIEQNARTYDFLGDVLTENGESFAPSYGALYRKKRKRESRSRDGSKKGVKRKSGGMVKDDAESRQLKNETVSAASIDSSHVVKVALESSTANGLMKDSLDEATLRQVIGDALPTRPLTEDSIIEDDDEYD